MPSKKRCLNSIALGLLIVLILVVGIQAQGAGVLQGQVVNGTPGGPEVGAGVPVTLHVIQDEAELDTLETTTDADGRFRFEGLDTALDFEYWPEATYLDVPFTTDEPYGFEGDATTLDSILTVYETTDDDSVVVLNSVHMIAESFGEVLRISEIHLYGNNGDRAYVGRDGTTLQISVPEGAVGLAFQGDSSTERFAEAEGVVLDSEPVPPGQETSLVFFSYHLMATGDSIPVERRFDYPVSDLNILVAQPGLTLNSSQLQPMGLESLQGQQYEFYAVQDLAPDTPLVLEFVPVPDVSGQGMPSEAGQPVAGGTVRGNQGLLLWIGFALTGLAVAGVVVYSLATKGPDAAPASTRDLISNPGARALLADLADLEEAHEAGKVDDVAFERRQAKIYEELKSL